MIGRRPHAAFGNSSGDQQMLEYTKAGDGATAVDARAARRRQRVSTPTARPKVCPTPRSAHSPQCACMTRPRRRAGSVISMKNDWKRIFAWEHWDQYKRSLQVPLAKPILAHKSGC